MNVGFLVSRYDEKRVRFAGEAGFDCLEVFTEKGAPLDIQTISDDQIKKILDIFAENRIKIATLACSGSINHLDGDKAKRKESNRYFIEVIKKCRKFETDIVTTNAWSNREKTPGENIEDYKEVFSEYGRAAESEGVKIAIENCPHSTGYPILIGNIGYSPEMWDAMFDAVPSKAIGLEFDPSHLYWLMIDYIKAIRDYGERIYAFHAKDTEIVKDVMAKCGIYGKQLGKTSEWDFGCWRYRIPGWGMIDWLDVFRALNDIGYKGSIIIEHEDPVFGGDRTDEGLKLGLRFLRQFAL